MAKRHHRRRYSGHKRHHRRHHRGHKMFGAIDLGLGTSSRLSSPVAGAVAGLAVGAGLKLLVASSPSLQAAVPNALQNNLILVGALAGGGVLYMVRKKKDPSAARGNLAGAVLAGGSAWLWDLLQSSSPMFSDVVSLNLGGGRVTKALSGYLVKENPPGFPPSFSGLLMSDPGKALQGPGNFSYGDGGSMNDPDDVMDVMAST